MSKRKGYKSGKRGAGRHVQLSEQMQCTPAWSSMPVGPRALYIELKRRYNGHNNGEIFLSHRDAARALNVHRNTIGGWFDCLVERGSSGKHAPHISAPLALAVHQSGRLKKSLPQTAKWLADLSTAGSQKQDPRTNRMTGCHNHCDR